MKLKPEAVRLLQRVKRFILAHPKQVDMSTWISQRGEDDDLRLVKNRYTCGTVGCIGGWTELLYRKNHPRSKKEANQILGVWGEAQDELFFGTMYREHTVSAGTVQYAKAVARQIDQFVVKYR